MNWIMRDYSVELNSCECEMNWSEFQLNCTPRSVAVTH